MVWGCEVNSIHENFPPPGYLEPQRSARTKTVTRRAKSAANMATYPAGQRGKKGGSYIGDSEGRRKARYPSRLKVNANQETEPSMPIQPKVRVAWAICVSWSIRFH